MAFINLQFALPLLAFTAVVCMGGAMLLGRRVRLRSIQARLDAGTATLSAVSEGQPSFFKALQGIGAAVAPRGPSKGLRQELARAGYYGHSAPYIFLGIK